MKALIVDDEKNVRKMIRFLGHWEKYGITAIWEAKNGIEAREIVEKEQPEIILTDVKMPRNNGIEFIEWLSAETHNGKVIMISGFDDYIYMRKALQHGCYDYLMKPIEETMLNEALKGAVAAWQQEEGERQNVESGFYDEVKTFLLDKEMTSACSGESFDAEEIASSLPQAKAYDLTLLYFYHTHHAEPYIRRLREELDAHRLGKAFVLQHEPQVCVLISCAGLVSVVEEWITEHFDIPVRLASGHCMITVNEIPSSFAVAQSAMTEQNFRAIHRLADMDDARRMQDMIAYVEEHYMEDVSLDKLSALFFLSREHISRRFKQEAGMTLSSYIIQLRVNQAKQWLRKTNEKMYSIALKLGYQDEIYFSKLFKKMVGMTPAEYRNVEKQRGMNSNSKIVNA